MLAERFELGERLGEGGQGYVCRGWDRREQRAVAIKLLSLQHVADWKALSLFERGTQLLQNLEHAGVPRVFAHEHDESSVPRTGAYRTNWTTSP